MNSERAPLVTLILLTFNQEIYVRGAIEAALRQTYSPLELLISDDCSSDRTFEVIQQVVAAYEGPHAIRINRNQANLGLVRHVEELTLTACGEIVVVAAGDDVSLPERVYRLVAEFRADPSCTYVHSAAVRMDRHSALHEKIESPGLPFFSSAARAARAPCLALGATAAWRPALVSAFPRMSTRVWAEDLVLGFRALLSGSVRYVEEPLVLYRSDTGITAVKHSAEVNHSRNIAIRLQRFRDALSRRRFVLSLQLAFWLTASSLKLLTSGLKVVRKEA